MNRRGAVDRLLEPMVRLRAWADTEATSDDRRRRLLAKSLQVLLMVARWDVIQRLQLHAQALTYDTLLAIVPTIALIFGIVGVIGGMNELKDRLEQFVLGNISGTPEMQASIAVYIHA